MQQTIRFGPTRSPLGSDDQTGLSTDIFMEPPTGYKSRAAGWCNTTPFLPVTCLCCPWRFRSLALSLKNVYQVLLSDTYLPGTTITKQFVSPHSPNTRDNEVPGMRFIGLVEIGNIVKRPTCSSPVGSSSDAVSLTGEGLTDLGWPRSPRCCRRVEKVDPSAAPIPDYCFRPCPWPDTQLLKYSSRWSVIGFG